MISTLQLLRACCCCVIVCAFSRNSNRLRPVPPGSRAAPKSRTTSPRAAVASNNVLAASPVEEAAVAWRIIPGPPLTPGLLSVSRGSDFESRQHPIFNSADMAASSQDMNNSYFSSLQLNPNLHSSASTVSTLSSGGSVPFGSGEKGHLSSIEYLASASSLSLQPRNGKFDQTLDRSNSLNHVPLVSTSASGGHSSSGGSYDNRALLPSFSSATVGGTVASMPLSSLGATSSFASLRGTVVGTAAVVKPSLVAGAPTPSASLALNSSLSFSALSAALSAGALENATGARASSEWVSVAEHRSMLAEALTHQARTLGAVRPGCLAPRVTGWLSG